MSQYTYTVGILGNNSSLLYSGQLVVQYGDTPDTSAIVQSASLNLNSFDPLTLQVVQGEGNCWNFEGSDASLSVSSTAIYGVGENAEWGPMQIGGYIELGVSGGAAQPLPIFGSTVPFSDTSSDSGGADAATEARTQATGTDSTGTDSYDYQLTLLDSSFKVVGTGSLQATGQLVHFRPVGQEYVVNGTLTLEQPVQSVQIGGQKMGDYLALGSADGNVVMYVAIGQSGYADGGIGVGLQQFFFVGVPTSSAAS